MNMTKKLMTLLLAMLALMGCKDSKDEPDYNEPPRIYVAINDPFNSYVFDIEGNVIYEKDMAEGAKEAVANLSATYPKLSGFTVTPKALLFSGFMSQQYMQGYYFPFSMEANYNDYMYIMNKPFTMCHEIAHTKGYI